MKSIKEAKNIKGKRVLVRVDFNVPIINGVVRDDFRIKKALPTILYLKKSGAKIILIAHAGEDGKQSLVPIFKTLLKHTPAMFIKTSIFDNQTKKVLDTQKNGTVVLLENIRREKGEKENSASFARGLARFGDIYVNDAFSVSHRVHASIVGIPKHLPSYAGLQLMEEVNHLSLAFLPKHPFLFILGGAKFSTKMPLVKKFLKTADTVCIAGALMNDFFKAKGYEVGNSLIDTHSSGIPLLLKNDKLLLPADVEVVTGSKKRFTSPDTVSKNETIVDIGPKTISLLKEQVAKAKLILWNGPLGKYESGFGEATETLLKAIANGKAHSIIGGGDTVALVDKLKLEKKLGFVSTGGGATLEFLAKGTLPGIKSLK